MTIFRNQGKKSQGIGFITGTLQFFVGFFLGQATDKQAFCKYASNIIIHMTDMRERERERKPRYS
jgi:hypothetical protein